MAKDTQRDKARATFGKTFFENSKAQANPKNSMAALQARANARPIPTFKVGGVVKKADGGRAGKDFTKPMMEAAARAAKKGTPVMKNGGVTAERLTERVKAGNYKDGGKAESRYDRKMADIEKDFRIAIAKGKDADVAKAKMNQRIADAKDDLAKATKQDRTATKAAEKAAERELTMTRRYGAAKPSETMKDKPIAAPKGPSEAESAAISALKPAAGLSAVSKTPAAKAAAPTKKAAVQVPPRRQMQPTAAQRAAQKAPAQQAKTQQAPAAKSGQPVTLATAFAQTPAKKAPAEARNAYTAMSDYYKNKAKREAEARANIGKEVTAAVASGGKYRLPRGLAAEKNGGGIGKYAAGGAGKVRKGMMKGK